MSGRRAGVRAFGQLRPVSRLAAAAWLVLVLPGCAGLLSGADRGDAAASASPAGQGAQPRTDAGTGAEQPVELRVDAPPEVAPVLSEFLRRPALAPTAATRPGVAERLRRDSRELLQALGYFSPSLAVDFADDGGIVLRAEPGPRTTVSETIIGFSGALTEPRYAAERARLERSFQMQAGEPFVSDAWQAAKSALLASVRSESFLRAQIVDSRATVDVAASSARLELTVDSGPPVEITGIEFVGLERYPERVVRDLISIPPGTPYSARVLREAQQVLQQSGWFNAVTVLPSADGDEDPSTTRIEVAVSERDRRLFTAGVGYSTDDGARARTGIEDRNLLGRGLIGKAEAIWSETGASLELQAREPYDREGIAYGATSLLSRSSIQSENVRLFNLTGYRSEREGTDETVLSVAYQFERRRLPGSEPETFRALVPGISWSRRALDDPLLPRSGFSLYLQLSGAGRWLLSDTSFVRAYGRVLWFVPLSESNLLLVRGETGTVFARDGDRVPTENLFRAGGALSVRGYEYQSLGIERSGAIVGGRVIGVASVEVQHSLAAYGAPSFSLAAFVDAGDVADHYTDLRPVVGTGVGVRWRTPVGPVNFDLAYGHDAERLRVHLTVGYPF